MQDIPVTYQNGVFVPDAPVDLPEGTKARTHVPQDEPLQMMREEDWPTTPEGIAALLARWKEHEPLIFTPEERAELRAGREWFKQYELEKMRQEMESEQ
jgi:predicted DNA-binding antitoxin AbrB/MazE fold protein